MQEEEENDKQDAIFHSGVQLPSPALQNHVLAEAELGHVGGHNTPGGRICFPKADITLLGFAGRDPEDEAILGPS